MIRENHKYISLSLHNEFDSIRCKSINLMVLRIMTHKKQINVSFLICDKSIKDKIIRLSCSYIEKGGEGK